MTTATMPMLLIEHFSVDPTQLNEANGTYKKKLPNGRWKVRCMGQHCWMGESAGQPCGLKKNKNNRRYPGQTTWGPHLQERSPFQMRIGRRRVIGQVEHPTDGRNSLGAAAILITKAEAPTRANEGKVFIEWETLPTPGGKIIAGLLEADVGFGMSSRAHGSCQKAHDDGVDVVQEDFEPVTWDCVADESTPGSEVAAVTIRESLERMVREAGSLEEAVRLDRVATAAALDELRACIAEGGEPVACCTQAAGAAGRAESTDHGTVVLAEGRGTYKVFDDGLGRLDVWNGTRLVAEAAVDVSAARKLAEEDAAKHRNSPPAGGEWILGGGDGHYRRFDQGAGMWEVWHFPNTGTAAKIAEGLPGRCAAVTSAEEHMKEAYQVVDTGAFEGTNVTLRFDSADEAKKCLSVLTKAGFYCKAIGEDRCECQTAYPCAETALAHIGRVLEAAGVEMVNEAGAPHGVMVPGTSYDAYMPEMGYLDEPEEPEASVADIGGYMDDDDEDEDDYLVFYDEPHYYEATNRDPPKAADAADTMVGEPGNERSDDEADDEPTPVYLGQDPEDLDVDVDVNEDAMREDYETGQQRKNTGVKGGDASAATTDAGAPSTRHGKAPDVLKKGGSAEGEKTGGEGETRADQRKPKEAGSELPKKGKGTSEPQTPAKQVEAVIAKALPDLQRCWARGNGRRAARISRFIERACRNAGEALREQHPSRRTRFLQNEVARLEGENVHLREMVEAMAEVQRLEILEYERKLALKEHPELEPMAKRLAGCDTVDELGEEIAGLMAMMKGLPVALPESTQQTSAPLNEDAQGGAGAGADPQQPQFRMLTERTGSNPGVSASSADVQGVPTKQPATGTAVVPGLLETRTSIGDTASRLVSHRRRRRRGGR